MKQTYSIGYLVAAFDMLNVAHLSLIDQVRPQCDRLVVGVLSDADIETVNGLPPVVPLDERLTLAGYLRDVDEVVEHTPAWVAAHPNAHVFALAPRSDVHVDEVISPSEVPSSDLLRSAISLPGLGVADGRGARA